MRVEVRVYPRAGVLDPQGKAIAAALARLGHGSVRDVRAGKVFFLDMDGTDPDAVEADARKMAEELLANTVIEGFDVKVVAAGPGAS
jgi:phosphoribosylformylglycinamidine synthase PurS subunit